MKGVGSHNNNDWPYYASPSSNLSAFAAPFSANRSSFSDVVSTPYVGSAESADAVVPPIQLPVQPRSYGYDFFSNPIRELDSTPTSKPYGYSVIDSSSHQLSRFQPVGMPPMDSFAYDQGSNSANPSLVEAQPYYPSFVSTPTPIHDPSPSMAPNDHWPSSSGFASLDGPSIGDYATNSAEVGFTGQRAGLWNQFSELSQGQSMQVGVGSSFSSNQTNAAGSVVEERMMNQGCQDVKDSFNGQVSHMIGWEKHSVPTSAVQLDGKSCLRETVSDSRNYHLSHTGSYDKHSRQRDGPLRVDTVSSTPISGLVTDLNIIEDGDLGNKNFYDIEEAYRRPSSGTADCFDLSHLCMHLERNEPSSSNNAMSSDSNVSRNVVDYIFKGMHGFQDPHANLDSISLRLSANEGVNSIEKPFDGADRCNPAIDSPCWKGAPAALFSRYQTSEAKPPEYVHKIDKCLGSVIQEHQNFLLDTDNNVKRSCKNSRNYQIPNEIAHQETNLAGSPRKFLLPKFASEYCISDSVVNDGPLQSEQSCAHWLKYLNDINITEMKENNVLQAKPIHDYESRSSHTEHHVGEENKLMSDKLHTLWTDGADAGSNVNNVLECGISRRAEHGLSSTSSVVDAPTTLEKLAGKVPTPNLNVQMLVETMHNLSELLLFHCLSDVCELKEQDHDVLENVISNLRTCALKNAEGITPSQECLFPQPGATRCAKESCKLQQNESFAKHQVGQESPKVELENPLVEEARNLHFKSGKLVRKLSDSISPRGHAVMEEEDNMTKALKRILSENFHDDEEMESQTALYKNLWLDAEAALCSITYKARYNQMKIEIEKCKQKDMEEQSSLSNSQSSAAKVRVDPNPDSSAEDLPILNAINLKDLSGSNFSVDMNKPDASKPEEKSSQDLDSYLQNSIVSSRNKEFGSDEASVMARFHVLKARVDKSCMNTANMEDLSDIAVKSPLTWRDGKNQVNSCQDSLPIKKNADDHEASIVARFRILKSRVEGSSSMSSEDKLPIGFAGKEMDDTIITTKASEGEESLDVHVNPSVVYFSSYPAVDKSIPREQLHLDLEDHEEIQPCGIDEFDNHLPTDGIALDWEHVEKRSF